MKIQISTLLTAIGFIVLVATVLGLMRFYPDLRRYLQMKSM